MSDQLRMLWPERLFRSYPQIELPKDYKFRSFQEDDEEAYVELMRKAGFKDWPAEQVQNILNNPLSPDGIYFTAFDGKLVATACALDRTTKNKRDATDRIGELGWLACDPAHRGKHLGKVVCAAVVNHFLLHSYCSISLLTDDWRLAAIKIYLGLGFEPVCDTAEMRWRWEKVCDELGWKIPDVHQSSR